MALTFFKIPSPAHPLSLIRREGVPSSGGRGYPHQEGGGTLIRREGVPSSGGTTTY